ncbi:hypothetical protein Hdeb2414_s0216g00836571 [Helianthus debilis subsp. tardiflorus]
MMRRRYTHLLSNSRPEDQEMRELEQMMSKEKNISVTGVVGMDTNKKNAKIWHRKINHQQVNEEKEQKHVKITNQSRAIYFFRTKWSKLWHLSFSFFGYCYMEFLWLFFWYDFLYRNGLKFWHFIFYLND